jgi:hypothetical protein
VLLADPFAEISGRRVPGDTGAQDYDACHLAILRIIV